MLDHDTFAAALRGREARLRDEVGPDAIVCVARELSSVFVVQPGEDGRQTGTLGGPGQVAVIRLPRTFQVRSVTQDGDEFVLTDADGRTARGTPRQFTAWPMLLDESVNPHYDEQLEATLLTTHLLPHPRETTVDCPRTDRALNGPEVAEILQAGEAMVTVGEDDMWLLFDNARPEKIEELLPHTRALLADIEAIGRAGAEFLWNSGEDDGEDDTERAEFLAMAAPTSLVVYLTGDFAIHYEQLSDTEFYMDGYWPAVQFRADRTPVDHYVDA